MLEVWYWINDWFKTELQVLPGILKLGIEFKESPAYAIIYLLGVILWIIPCRSLWGFSGAACSDHHDIGTSRVASDHAL
jgi:hypothetical protein